MTEESVLYSSCGNGFKVIIAILHNYHVDKLVTFDKQLVLYLGHGGLLSSHLLRFENIAKIWSILLYSV
jgi:hypothetical protein